MNRITRILKPVWQAVSAPFERSLAAWAALVAIQVYTSVVMWALCSPHARLWPTLAHIPMAVVGAWLVLVPGALLPRWCRSVWQGLWIAAAACGASVDVFCLSTYGVVFGRTMMGMVLGTNGAETMEFLRAYITPGFLGWELGGAVWVAAAAWGAKYLRCGGRLVLAVLLPSVAICSIIGLMGYCSLCGVGDMAYNKISALTTVKAAPKVVGTVPQIVRTAAGPHDVVVVIGESQKPSHMSIYGYPLPTTPRLEALMSAGELQRVDSAVSPEFHTIAAFKRFMSEYTGTDSLRWYCATNLIDLARAAGYRTVWISNQNRAGIYDNIVTRFALHADRARWTRTRADAAMFVPDYDELLLPLLDEELRADTVPTVWFVHLMGCHNFFSQRYPRTRHHFGISLYGNAYSPKAAAQVACYDNAMRYSDSIVAAVFRRFEGRDAAGVFFSDHGLDLYESNPTLFTHAIDGNEASMDAARPIPFVLWRVPFEAPRAINTDTLIRTMSRIMGVRIEK